MDIVDEISIRIPFFIQFENLISFKKLEVEYCKKKLNINDLSYYINNNVFSEIEIRLFLVIVTNFCIK